MSWSYVHLTVNHFPVILTLLGLAAVVAALVLRRRAVWLYATATLALAGLSAWPAFFAGSRAEDALEGRWYVAKAALQAHEEAGEAALWLLLVMGAVSAWAWWRMMRRGDALPARWMRPLLLVLSLAGAGSVAVAARQGGKIVHQSPALEAGAPGRAPMPAAARQRREDDDAP